MNRNATFKKIFESLESDSYIAYSNLPEETTGQKIYKLRMLSGNTQREFAKKCSIGYSSICKYETGSTPSIKNLKKVCNVFNIKIDYFIK